MEFINIHDAKTNLSKYLDRLKHTHETIVICKNGVPIGQLKEYIPNKKRILGALKGKIKIKDNFDDDLPDDVMG